jgi:phytoene synthase
VYLPLEEIKRFGCSEEVIEQGRVTLDFVELMKFEISRARSFYRRADAGIPLVTNDGSRFCVRAMSSLYERILDVIERNGYDVFRRRLAVSFMEKVGQLIKLRTQPPLWPMASAKV